MKKFIDFIITQACSYDCSYCSQSKAQTKEKTFASKETLDNFLKFLNKIDNDFLITITGGEAILHPEFYNLIEKIKNKNFKINLITNFSFPFEKYIKIFNILNSSLNEFAISFHLEQIVDFENTIDKLNKLLKEKPLETKFLFLIPIVNLTDEKEKQIEKILEIAKNNKIEYNFQHIRILNKPKELTDLEKKYLKETKCAKTFAKNCFAGLKSAVIYEDGSVYRCYSSRFSKSNYLGNINDKNFKLLNTAKPCTMKNCTCPKPLKYGQILNSKSKTAAILLKIQNIIFLPKFLLKNKNILKIKLKQYFDFKKTIR